MLGSAAGNLRKPFIHRKHDPSQQCSFHYTLKAVCTGPATQGPATARQCPAAAGNPATAGAAASANASFPCSVSTQANTPLHTAGRIAKHASASSELPVPLCSSRDWKTLSTASTSNRSATRFRVLEVRQTYSTQLLSGEPPDISVSQTAVSNESANSNNTGTYELGAQKGHAAGLAVSEEQRSTNIVVANPCSSVGEANMVRNTDQRCLLARQLQHLVLPAQQFDEDASSVLQQAALIAAAAAAEAAEHLRPSMPGHQTATAAPPPPGRSSVHNTSSNSSTSRASKCLLVSEQHLLLALLHHSPAAMQDVADSIAAVPAVMAAAHATAEQRVVAAVTAAAQYVEGNLAVNEEDYPAASAAELDDPQQQQLQEEAGAAEQQQQQSNVLQLSAGVLHVLQLARNASRCTGGVPAGVLQLLHGLASLSDATVMFQSSLGVRVITADLRQLLELEWQHLQTGSSACNSSSSGSSASCRTDSSSTSTADVYSSVEAEVSSWEFQSDPMTISQMHTAAGWRQPPSSSSSSSGYAEQAIPAPGVSSKQARYSRLNTAVQPSGSSMTTDGGRYCSSAGSAVSVCTAISDSSSSSDGSSSTPSLLSSLYWVDSTIASILLAAEQKDPAAAVATLTNAITTLATQQQQHVPEPQWLAAAWQLIAQRLHTYLCMSCYLKSSTECGAGGPGAAAAPAANSLADSIEQSIQGAAHAEAASLLSGVAAAASVSLHSWQQWDPDVQCLDAETSDHGVQILRPRMSKHNVQGLCSAVDQIMNHLAQFDGSSRWQLGEYNISDLYLPVMIQLLPVAAVAAAAAPAAAPAARDQGPGQGTQSLQQQCQSAIQQVQTAVFGRVYSNFVQLANQLAAMQQPELISAMLGRTCTPQLLAESLLVVLEQESHPSTASHSSTSSNSSLSSGRDSNSDSSIDTSGSNTSRSLHPNVVVAFCTSLTAAVRSSSSSSNFARGSSKHKPTWPTKTNSNNTLQQQQQQDLRTETVVQVVRACQALPASLSDHRSVLIAATELTAAAWIAMAAAADSYNSQQLVRILKAARHNRHFLRYAAAIESAAGMPPAPDFSSSRSSTASGPNAPHAEMKSLVTGTKHILQRLCTKKTLSPEEAAAALSVLDTPLWPTSHSAEISQSPLVQGLLNRVTDSIQHMTAGQLEQLLSVAVRLPWGEVGFKLSREWMSRVLTALVKVTTNVAAADLDAATVGTLAAALGDLCDLPVAATEQQMQELQRVLPLLLPKLDERHTSMVLAFVSRQTQLNIQTAFVKL